jgi:hypothetical protein
MNNFGEIEIVFDQLILLPDKIDQYFADDLIRVLVKSNIDG